MTVESTVVLTALVWAVTFPLAWWSLGRLVAQAVGTRRPYTSPGFWVEFIFYRLVIFAPYGVVLFSGAPISPLVYKLLWGWVLLGLALSVLRFVGSQRVTAILWWVYGWFYDGLRSFYPYRKLIGQVAGRIAGKKDVILDLGCGTGNLIEELVSKEHVKIVGVDSSATMLRSARKKLKNHIRDGRVELVNSPLLEYLRQAKTGSFDSIALVNVLYVENNRTELWRELMRVVKPSGEVVVTNSDRGGSRELIKEHLRHDLILKLLDPRLIAIGIIDHFISQLEKTKVFDFTTIERLVQEVSSAGGSISGIERTYGGANLLFTVKR